MIDTRISIDDFIAQHKITMSVKEAKRNPNLPDPNMDHWRATLRMEGRRMGTPFSQGQGFHGEPPTLARILRALADDAALIENSEDFESFCGEIGAMPFYDEAAEKRERRSYQHCINQTERLKTFLGQEAYEQLVWNSKP